MLFWGDFWDFLRYFFGFFGFLEIFVFFWLIYFLIIFKLLRYYLMLLGLLLTTKNVLKLVQTAWKALFCLLSGLYLLVYVIFQSILLCFNLKLSLILLIFLYSHFVCDPALFDVAIKWFTSTFGLDWKSPW